MKARRTRKAISTNTVRSTMRLRFSTPVWVIAPLLKLPSVAPMCRSLPITLPGSSGQLPVLSRLDMASPQ